MDAPRGPIAEVIAIGDELTTGARLDTNSRWISAELAVLGIPTAFHTTAPDALAAGIEAFRIATGRADLVVATGGLGPTADDLTRDVLAAVADEPLLPDAASLVAIESRFARRGAPMAESNRRQALFPRGARIVPNPEGTAPGIDLDVTAPDGRRCRAIALPGVPSEMKAMWRETVGPALARLVPGGATIVQRRIKCFGAGESAIEALLPDLVRRGREPLVGITAHEATITLRIAARGRTAGECLAAIRGCLGDLVYGVEDDEIEDATVRAVAAAGLVIASAEIGTEGLVAALLAQAGGRASENARVVAGGLVLPATEAATGPETAVTLAARARREFDAPLGLGVGGPRRGPDGRTVLDLAFVGPLGPTRIEHTLGGARDLARSRAAKAAIDLVRRSLSAAGAAGRTETERR
ncbi:MAG: molybdopterin-binding protein [Planctomycetaceae bacterium]